MQLKKTSPLAPSLALTILFGVGSAQAHIRMDEPVARNVWANTPFMDPIKAGPCGSGADDPRSTDPAKINVFTAGETITVSWHETIDHPAHYRIALDMDGQDDFVDPTGPDDIVDPPVPPVLLDGIQDKTDGSYSVQVTLPNEACDNCTLQLIQFMHDSNESYYTCADLVIEADPNGGGDGDASSGGSSMGSGGMPSEDGSGGAPSAASGGASTGGNPPGTGGQISNFSGGTSGDTTGSGQDLGSGGQAPTDGVDPENGDPDAPKSCAVPVAIGQESPNTWGAWLLALMAGLVFWRRLRA